MNTRYVVMLEVVVCALCFAVGSWDGKRSDLDLNSLTDNQKTLITNVYNSGFLAAQKQIFVHPTDTCNWVRTFNAGDTVFTLSKHCPEGK